MNVSILNEDGSRAGEVTLAPEIFGAKVNVPLMHQVVTAQRAAARAGTHATKTRGEVRGGGRKPWRQKGTGRARHGSIREPQWVGGGVAFGPQPRDYSQRTPKKMKALALRSALSARAGDEKIVVVAVSLDEPKTRRAVKALEAWNLASTKVLVVVADRESALGRSFRNLPAAHVIAQDQLNAYDVLNADTVVFEQEALEAFQSRARSLPGRSFRQLAEVAAAASGATSAGESPETAPAAEAGSEAPDDQPEVSS